MESLRPPAVAWTTVREIPGTGVPCVVHPEWARAFPWVVQGTTTAGEAAAPFDLGLFTTGSDPERARSRWRRLREVAGADRVMHAHQVHGADVHVHGGVRPGASLSDPVMVGDCDGHLTAAAGTCVAVTTADCVPVFVVAPVERAVGALHAGWRGAVAGVLERGVQEFGDAFGSRPETLRVHFGPSICGRCYEVGPEVFAALGQAPPDAPTPIDLRCILAERAVALGVPAGSVTVSAHCTVCTGASFFSHRAGHAERQVGFIGVRA